LVAECTDFVGETKSHFKEKKQNQHSGHTHLLAHHIDTEQIGTSPEIKSLRIEGMSLRQSFFSTHGVSNFSHAASPGKPEGSSWGCHRQKMNFFTKSHTTEGRSVHPSLLTFMPGERLASIRERATRYSRLVILPSRPSHPTFLTVYFLIDVVVKGA